MKIVLSERMRKEAIGLLGVELGIMLLPFWWIIEDFELWLVSEVMIFTFLTSIFGILLCCRFRLFTHVIVKTDCFKAFLFKKELSVVDKNEPIYYARFKGLLTRGVEGDFILISNYPFRYEAPPLLRVIPREAKALLHSYDVKTQIVMPYNENTKKFFEIEKWINVTEIAT